MSDKVELDRNTLIFGLAVLVAAVITILGVAYLIVSAG